MAGVMIVVAVVIYRSLDISGLASKQLAQFQQINTHLKALETTITRQDAGLRDYILSAQNPQLHLTRRERPGNIIEAADSLLTKVPGYTQQVNRLHDLVGKKNAVAQEIAAQVDSGHIAQAVVQLDTGKGKQLADSIAMVSASVMSLENYRLAASAADEVNNNKGIFILLSTGIMLCLLLLAIFYLMIIRNAKLKEQTEEDLMKAKNIAESADKSKSTFLATMSHEIRSPLHDIIGTASLLEETELTDEQQKFAAIIQRSSVSLLSVVNDIIDFSNIETGKLPLENSAFVLRDCLEEVLAVGAAVNTASLLNYTIDQNLPELVECDPARLRQVLLTITDSLVKSSVAENIHCHVTLLKETGNQLEIEFTVLANLAAPGPFDSTRQHLNNPGSAGESNIFGMSSIRFSIAARLVSLMGGNVKVTTDTGKSNTIIFTIKAARAQHNQADKMSSSGKNMQLADNDFDKVHLHILVVDDHEVNQAILVQMLTKLGYSCKTARNGLEAATIAVEEKFDLIFMDIAMPVMDGLDATKRIREYYVNNGMPLIVGVTANALFIDKQKGYDAGMNDFLIKPYQPADIRNMLNKWTAMVLKQRYDSPPPPDA